MVDAELGELFSLGVARLVRVDIAPNIRVRLSASEAEALSVAVDGIDDFLLGELVDRYAAPADGDEVGSFSSEFLPQQFRDLYDFGMLRRLHACLLVVAGRLQDGWEPPQCRGEELVLRAVLDYAETCYEDVSGDSTESFVDLRELLFEDLDHEYLFDPRFDGIDDPETREGAQMRVQPLHPSSWFVAFYEGGSVHPMTLS